MDQSEKIVSEYLAHFGFRDVVHHPDGKNNPPDILVDGRIAIEVRRLNQNEDTPDGHRGLEEVAIPLQGKMRRFLKTLGPADGGESWYVMYSVRRPLPPWKQLAKALRGELAAFRDDPQHPPLSRRIAPGFRVRLYRAGRPYPEFFVLGGYTDSDSGGFVLSELDRNIRLCVAEKKRKIARVRDKYAHWWLALVDRIGYGLSELDREQLRQLLHLEHSWEKIILVSPIDATQGYEL